MPNVTVKSLKTYYEQVGSGPVLLLLHGWANTWEAWLPIVPILSDHFTLVMPDLPGCGQTETPKTGWSTRDHALWLADFLEAVGYKESNAEDNSKVQGSGFRIKSRQAIPEPLTLNPLYACGHSYGGKILVEYTSGNYDPHPTKIVLIASSGVPNILGTKQKWFQRLSNVIPKQLKENIGQPIREKLYKQFDADSDYLTANTFQKQTLQIILKEDYTDRLAKISAKTLLFWGKEDHATPLWQGETFKTLIPLNQMHVYDTGHFPHHVYPQRIGEAIIQFLK